MAHPFAQQLETKTPALEKQRQNPFQKKKRSQLIGVVILTLVALGIAGASLFLYLKAQQTKLLITEQAPVAITLNGKAVSGTRTSTGVEVMVTAGRYRINIEKQGFSPFVADITAAKGETLVIRPSFALATSDQPANASAVDEPEDSSIAFVRSDPSGSSIAFLGDAGERLYRLNLNATTATPLTTAPLYDVRDVQWSNDPNVALVVLEDGVYLHEIPLYNFVTQRFDQIASNEVRSPVWDPTDSNRIAAYLKTTSGERSIILTDKRFSRIIRILTLTDLPDVRVSWLPTGDALLLRGIGTEASQKLWLLKISNSELQSFDISGVTNAIPNPSGSHILYQKEEGDTLTRYLLEVASGTSTKISGSGTVAKLAWRTDTSFFEPSEQGDSLILRGTDGKQQQLPLTTPPSSEILSVHYLATAKRIIFATATGLYAVSAP